MRAVTNLLFNTSLQSRADGAGQMITTRFINSSVSLILDRDFNYFEEASDRARAAAQCPSRRGLEKASDGNVVAVGDRNSSSSSSSDVSDKCETRAVRFAGGESCVCPVSPYS